MTPTPPRLAERLLARVVGRFPSGRYLLADLREEYAERARDQRAGWWYCRQAAIIAARFAVARPPARLPDGRTGSTTGDQMRTDLTLALRTLAKRPLLSGAIVATIGGALAATSIAFALVDGILLRPLPFATPDRLVNVWEYYLDRGADHNVVSPFNYDAWRRQLTTVEDLTAVMETSAALSGDGDPVQIGVVLSSGPLFSLIGGRPVVGRFYGAEDDAPGGPPVAVISERLWRTRFGADPSIVGRSITMNGSDRTVIGVLPSRLDFAPANSWGGVGTRDLYVPLQYGPQAWNHGGRFLQVVGRLKAGASLEALQDKVVTLTDRRRREFPDRLTGWSVNPVRLRDDVVGAVETPLAIVFAAVSLMLLIACANVANLLMLRARERRAELAVRSALGAGRWAIARQVFGESLLLAGLGVVAGGFLSAWGIGALVAAAPDLPRIDELRVSPSLLGFLGVAGLVVAGLIGIGPAIETAGRDPGRWLAQRGAVGDRRADKTRRMLVGVQVAASVVLVLGAGVLVRSLVNRLSVRLGFDPANVLTAQINLRGDRYRAPAARIVAFDRLVERLGAIPGVSVASAASIVPMSDKGQSTAFVPLDRPRPEPGEAPTADVRFVHHDYFKAMRIGLRAGRTLEATDRADQPTVVVINAAGAEQLWPNESPIGKRIEMEWGDTLRAEVVGVVDDVRLKGPDDQSRQPTLYWDQRQTGAQGDMALVIRGERTVPDLAAVRAAVRDVDPTVPLYNAGSLEMLRADAVARSRFLSMVLTLFSLLSLGLSALGVYGIMAHGVQQRSREIGVRLALGADRGAVVRMFLREAATIVAPALLAGLTLALAVSRFLRSLVFGISPADPLTMVGGLGLILAVAALASWLPARRGATVAPAEAIRSD